MPRCVSSGGPMKSVIFLVPGLLSASVAYAADARPRGPDWQVAGRLGLLQFVVVSESRAKDRAFYDSIVTSLCEPDATCFLRFFTNSKKAPVKAAAARRHPRRADRDVPALGEAGQCRVPVELPHRSCRGELFLAAPRAARRVCRSSMLPDRVSRRSRTCIRFRSPCSTRWFRLRLQYGGQQRALHSRHP